MTPDEQRMIQDLFQRLTSQGGVAKDPQAERLISNALRSNPDAGYMLVQTALVYEHNMNEQELRIRDLEDQIAQMQQSQNAAPAGGSFLGGRIGTPSRGAVPGVAAATATAAPWQQAPQPQAYQQAQPQQRGGWFGGGAPAQAPMMAPQAAPAAGGGFFRSALTTAAGVAGGMMVANSLGGMFGGGNNAHAAGNPSHNPADLEALRDADRTQDEMQDRLEQQEQEQQDTASAEPDLGGWDGVET
jgi:uncharacterized protein